MQVIELKHTAGTVGDKNTNIGVIAASTTGGEISCSWRSATLNNDAQMEGSANFRASSPIYRSDNAATSGALTIPLNRVDATIAVVTFLNNTDHESRIRLSVSVGNRDGTTPGPQEKTEQLAAGDCMSFQIAFTPQ